ncbi:magnesium transporter [Prosthecochloris sp. N3]|uniref:Magnesium transporter MgtE n=1 Tax=Prosthecochloris ethylica TaxID=2743976 RepID=A0ABR9XP95_9CHLB|nr:MULTISPECIES: magnesium transporter [Prosthecochloris]MEC9487379.1 magnesium transporter [Prosthecochloris sp.]MBF0585711.1 magnesium transporter [Prosthecochloris ethylica]MBF0635621.1 magnesium transporter [Prosthecochloris ethylica]NUK46920.1 magnesium transporter [Prosthecochloris ethylica]RNA65415.1 magnesium transporter [Prosthecochloris sp. ZM_2]
MIGNPMLPEIRELIERRNFSALQRIFTDWLPVDLAELISDLPENEQAILFRLLPREVATVTFEYLDIDAQQNLLEALTKKDVTHILNSMSPDDRTEMLEELPSTVVQELLKLLSFEEFKIAKTLLAYSEDSVGRLMSPDYISVKKNWTIAQVLDYIRRYGHDSETLNVIYVIDDYGKLIGELASRELLLSQPERMVRDLISEEKIITLTATQDQQDALEAFKRYDRVALPVVDSNGYLIGIVTVDDMLDVAEEEETEDIQKFGGIEALEEPYMDLPLWQVIKKRGVWLIVLFLGEMLTASAMAFFEDELSKAIVLATFIPLIISSGGNSGSQAATLIIRALALGEISIKDWWRVMRREILSGLALGSILGAIGVFRVIFWSLILGTYNVEWLTVGYTVGASLVGVVLLGTLAGSMLPLILERLGLDPATSSAPFVATIVDVAGIIIYFSVATVFLSGILL